MEDAFRKYGNRAIVLMPLDGFPSPNYPVIVGDILVGVIIAYDGRFQEFDSQPYRRP